MNHSLLIRRKQPLLLSGEHLIPALCEAINFINAGGQSVQMVLQTSLPLEDVQDQLATLNRSSCNMYIREMGMNPNICLSDIHIYEISKKRGLSYFEEYCDPFSTDAVLYKIKSLEEQALILSAFFPELKNFEYDNDHDIPGFAEGLFLIPSQVNKMSVAWIESMYFRRIDSYTPLVNYIFGLVAQTVSEYQLVEFHDLQLHRPLSKFFENTASNSHQYSRFQGSCNTLLLPLQLHRKSALTTRAAYISQLTEYASMDLPVDLYICAILMLTHPEIFMSLPRDIKILGTTQKNKPFMNAHNHFCLRTYETSCEFLTPTFFPSIVLS